MRLGLQPKDKQYILNQREYAKLKATKEAKAKAKKIFNRQIKDQQVMETATTALEEKEVMGFVVNMLKGYNVTTRASGYWTHIKVSL